MSRPLAELEQNLQLLIDEHQRLLKTILAQQAAMKVMDLKAMDQAANQQEASRLRIATLEQKRRWLTTQLSHTVRVSGEVTLKSLAEAHGPQGQPLLKLREELRGTVAQIQARSHVSGKLAGAVLGHLNTVVRLFAGAVEKAGVYTKHGLPRVSSRIGVMEAVG